MKMLHLIGSMNANTGGPCQMIRNIAPAFLAHGHILEVVCLDDAGSAYLSEDAFRIHALGPGRGPWNYHPKLIPWLKERLPEYDAVILHGLWQFPGYALWQATQHGDAPPYYIFPHGMLDPWFQKLSVRPVKALRNWVYWKAIQHRIVSQSAGLLFTCEEEQRLARLPFRPYHPAKEVVVGLGIPEPPQYHEGMNGAFAERCPGIKGAKYFLFLGRIHPKKGVDLLIKAFAHMSRFESVPGQEPASRLVIAGPGLDALYGREMQRIAAQICPADSVLWPGMLAGDAKWGALYNAEAFALASHQENFGIAVVEALACGKPVLISSQINIWREIKEDRAGLVMEDTLHGTKELFRQWKHFSPDKKKQMQDAARACYKNRFGIAPAYEKLLDALSHPGKRTFGDGTVIY